jgi:hypothetical protein
MYEVAASEYDLLTIARAIVDVRQGGFDAVEGLLRRERKLAPKLSPAAVRALEETLSKGVVLALVRRGGWRSTRHLSGKTDPPLVSGRMWERRPPPELRFTPATMDLLRWLTSQALGAARVDKLTRRELSLGDELFIYLVADLLSGSVLARVLSEQPLFQGSLLAALAFPELRESADVDFAPLVTGDPATVVEALQEDLARRWRLAELERRQLATPAQATNLGKIMETVLRGYLQAADEVGRRDLALFVLVVTRALVPHGVSPLVFVERLAGQGSLSERTNAHRAAGAILRSGFATWRRWNDEHRGVRFFDDGYECAQLLLGDYERLGADRATDVDRVLGALDSLESLGPAPQQETSA